MLQHLTTSLSHLECITVSYTLYLQCFFLGYFCSSGASSPTPTDGTTGNVCPAGQYCIQQSTQGTDCPKGSLIIEKECIFSCVQLFIFMWNMRLGSKSISYVHWTFYFCLLYRKATNSDIWKIFFLTKTYKRGKGDVFKHLDLLNFDDVSWSLVLSISGTIKLKVLHSS